MAKTSSLFFLLCLMTFSSLNANAQGYPKVILSGDYPDPTLFREGNDYYMTHSAFTYMPGFLIWHSPDLMNWEPVCRIVPEFKGSAWAPDLLKHDGKYYLYYPADGTNWVSWAENIKGPWSKPIDLKIGGIDPGHIVGQDGTRYLYVNNGFMIQLADDGLSTVGEGKTVYEGWEYPKEWETECMCLESPKLNYKDGYYYLTSAQGGTAGPATSHMVVSARSKSPTGPWENSPYNPIVHTYSADERWWSKGHGSLVDDVNGNWWILYHAYENGYYTLGRQTLIEPIEWTSDGWFRTKKDNPAIVPAKKIKHGMELSDNFRGSKLGLQWTYWKESTPEMITIKKGSLSVSGKGESPANGNKLLVTAVDRSYTTQVKMETVEGGKGGIILFYNEEAYAGIVGDEKAFTIYKDGGNSMDIPNEFGKSFYLKISNKGNNCTFYASKNGSDWKLLADNIDVSELHHNKYWGFYALRPGLVSLVKGKSVFRDFRYKGLED